MTCVLEPVRTCGCCAAGRPCAFVLQLDAGQQRQLDRVLELVGLHPQPLKSSTIESRADRVDVEPVTVIECYDCERSTEMLTYLHDFLVTNHVRLPVCPVCAADRRAA